ncbi:glycosyl hydrolase family 7 [Pyrenophora seminiperda CCB06]|uniref:Glucanase n=1 Tax=Pyrenophora seminiperda CCB06 TaxID=1302712 RepID=A0A3M7MC42_9PLEO|nr:glycosyl hydrolase family 7 [Pyrenophora seminiperda CCB06]
MPRYAFLAAALVGLATAQSLGTTPEVHPRLQTWKCTKAGGCKSVNSAIVLDASSHNIHQKGNASAGCGNFGSAPPASVCPDKATCAKNCIMDGISDYKAKGVSTQGSSLRLDLFDPKGGQSAPRVYLLGEDQKNYEMMKLTGNEFTFDVDASKLPCGMNGALYLSEMAASGGRSALNPGGATYGTGYCDAQCFNGCADNPYNQRKSPDFYGPSKKVDTTKPFTVVTQFPAKNGVLQAIVRKYVQGGKVVDNAMLNITMDQAYCTAQGATMYNKLGGHKGMGEALARGMVLAMSIWWDESGGMNWLDSGSAGPCSATEGFPAEIVKVEAKPTVTFSGIKWGEIGSTFKEKSTTKELPFTA